MRKAKIETVEIIEIPPEQQGAIDTAWRRLRQLAWGMPLWMLEAMKPMLVSIYMQGMVDGYGAAEREAMDKARAAADAATTKE